MITIISLIIILFVSGIYIYVTNYALATISFLGDVFQETKETDEYYLIVRKDSSYAKIEDIENKNSHLIYKLMLNLQVHNRLHIFHFL